MRKSFISGLLILTNTICFSQTFNSARLDSLLQVLDNNNKFMGAITICQNGNLLYSKAIGYTDVENLKKATVKTRYRVGSISKMFTACLILKAIEEEKLTLNQSLSKYYPGIENSNKITVENLLNHKSGLHDFTNDKNYLSYNTEPKSERQMIEVITNGKSDFEPDSKVEYNNSNYIVLSYILEKVYKKSYATILNAKIIKPLKLKDTYFGSKIQTDNNESYSYHYTNKWVKGTETNLSIPMGAGGIVSNTTDLNSFIQQLFNGRIISQNSLSLMITMSKYHGIGIGMGMLEFSNLDKKSYGHNGAIDDFASLLNYFQEERLSIAVTSNGLNYPMDNLLLCALSCYFDKPFAIPSFNYLEIQPALLNLYSGEYISEQIPLEIAVIIDANKLFGQVKGQPVFPLEATATNIFKFEQAGLILEFDSSKKQMILKQRGKEFLFTKE